ncbi:YjaG family protein [Alteromonas sp. CI.11.F.A3]|uniref:YjaG family protein n=1 Tax=unclassified Alteromonas TaxID=2614992 RepID=UPI001B39D959|nr:MULTISPECIES: YjaG family protein [unclassified Alteromonas]MBQ4831193.1 YjaG family protein [Alteromonas sp. MMG017]WOI37987.1 YjaG family protein [Alteromonas sp. CI.11.F.A3]
MAKQKLNTFGRVRALEGFKAVAFSAALLERMIPNYELFCEVTEFGDKEGIRNCLNLVWESVKAPKSKFNLAVQLEKVEVATPDTSDFDTYGVYPAIDAAIGLAAVLNLIAGDDPQGAVVVSKLSQGSVEAYLLESGEADDETVKEHPLMVFEVAVQEALLDCVEAGKSPASTADALKAIALEEGISNIGLDLA